MSSGLCQEKGKFTMTLSTIILLFVIFKIFKRRSKNRAVLMTCINVLTVIKCAKFLKCAKSFVKDNKKDFGKWAKRKVCKRQVFISIQYTKIQKDYLFRYIQKKLK